MLDLHWISLQVYCSFLSFAVLLFIVCLSVCLSHLGDILYHLTMVKISTTGSSFWTIFLFFVVVLLAVCACACYERTYLVTVWQSSCSRNFVFTHEPHPSLPRRFISHVWIIYLQGSTTNISNLVWTTSTSTTSNSKLTCNIISSASLSMDDCRLWHAILCIVLFYFNLVSSISLHNTDWFIRSVIFIYSFLMAALAWPF